MKIVEVLIATRSVLAEYKDTHSPFETQIEIFKENCLQTLVSKHTDKEIEIECLSWSGSMFASRMDNKGDTAQIWYSDRLNTCWSRFNIAKELTHILCGNDDNYTKDVTMLISSLINDIALNTDHDDCMLEWQAYFGAIELLIPTYYYDYLYKLERENYTSREIAEKLSIPESVINFRLQSKIKGIFDDYKNNVN